jgi:hypothetical protein
LTNDEQGLLIAEVISFVERASAFENHQSNAYHSSIQETFADSLRFVLDVVRAV